MKSKYKIEPIINCILCILAFLLGLGFLGGSNYLFLAIGLICAVRSIVKKRLIISHNLLWIVFLCIFSLFSIFIFQGFSLNYLVQFVAIPIFAYFVFCDLRSKSNVKSNNSKLFNRFFLCLLLGTLTEIILFYICSVRELGFDLSTRMVANPWYYLGVSKTHFLTGTVLSLPCTLIILFGLSLIIKKNRPLLSVLFIASSVFVVYYSIKMQNRGFFVAFVGALVVLALNSYNIFKKKITADVLTTIAILVLGISLFLVIITAFFPKSSIADFLSNIPILKRFLDRGTDSERLGHYKEFFSLFYKYPFGGLNKHVSYAYVHNTVLDVYNVVGLIPTLVIGFFYVRFFIDYYKVCVHSKHFENRYSILFPFFIAIPFLILSLIEPVWDGNPALFGTILVLILATNQHSVELNNKYKFVKKIDIDNSKVVFINKSLINHVSPLHEKLVNKYKERYTCITYEDLDNDHKKYEKNNVYKNEIRINLNDKNELEKAKNIINQASIIIYSNCPRKLLFSVFKKHKLIFQLSERPYAESKYECYKPKSIFNSLLYSLFFERYKPICLSASIYTPNDYAIFNHSLNKCLFFPYLFKKNKNSFNELDNKKLNILWVNRLIDWKHPEKVIELARKLKDERIDFNIKIVGFGDPKIEENIKKDIKQFSLIDNVEFVGALNNVETQKLMRSSHILLSTSDMTERCGCTVVEGMSNGCCVIASHLVGSAPLLINHGVNGFIYDFNSNEELYLLVKYCYENPTKLNEIRKEAYEDCQNIYNIDIAFNSLIENIEKIKKECQFDGENKRIPCGLLNQVNENDVLKNRKEVIEKKKEKEIIPVVNEKKKEVSKVQNTSKISKSAVISYISVAISILIGFFYTPWIINTLGQSNYAIYSLAGSVIGLVTVDIGISTAAAKLISCARLEEDPEKANKSLGLIYKIMLIVGAILAVLLVIIYFLLGNIYSSLTNDELASLKVVYIMVAIFSLFAFECMPLDGILTANDKFKDIKLLTLFTKVLDVLFVVLAVSINGGLYVFTLATVIANVITLIIKYIYIKKTCTYGTKIDFSKSEKKDFTYVFKLVLWVAISAIASRFIITLQPTILGIYAGSKEIALFSLAASIESYFFMFSSAINGMLMPNASNMKMKNVSNKEYEEKMIKVGRIQLFILCMILYAWIAFGKGFITNVWKAGGSEFSYENSYFVSLFLVIPTVINSISYFGYLLLINEKKEKYYAFGMITTAVISTALSFVLCSILTENVSMYAALAVFVGNIVGNFLLNSYFYQKHLKINIWKFYFKTIVCVGFVMLLSLVFGMALDYLWPTYSIGVFIAKILIFAAFYIGNVYVAINKEEHELMTAPFKKLSKLSKKKNKTEDAPKVQNVESKEVSEYSSEEYTKLFTEPYKSGVFDKNDARILIVGTLPYFEDSQSRAFNSYFASFKKKQLRQIYSSPRIPQKGHCESLYQITDQLVLNNFIKFKHNSGTIYYDKDLLPQGSSNEAVEVNNKLYESGKKKTCFKRILRNLIWTNRTWNTNSLNCWVEEFKPNVIFLAWSDDCFIPRIAKYFSDKYKCPIISCIGDDYLYSKPNNSLFKVVYNGTYLDLVLPILKDKVNSEIYIDDPIKDFYNEKFNKNGVTVHVGSTNKVNKQSIPEKIRSFCYFGNLNYGRYDTIIKFASELKRNNYDFEINIYTSTTSKKVFEKLSLINEIKVNESIPNEKIINVVKNNDAVIVCESLNKEKYIKQVRYSLSTKVAESLTFGKPIIAIGNKKTGLIQYFEKNKCGVVIDDFNKVYEQFISKTNKSDLLNFNKNCIICLGKDFDIEKSNKIFSDQICKISYGGMHV